MKLFVALGLLLSPALHAFENGWTDVTTTGDGKTASTCAASPNHCAFQQPGSALQFSKLSPEKKMWPHAVDYCAKLNFNGHQDWRLPSHSEIRAAIRAKIEEVTSANFVPDFHQTIWSSSSNGFGGLGVWVELHSGIFQYGKASIHYRFFCVRENN